MVENRDGYNNQFKPNDIAFKLICTVESTTDRDGNLALLTSLGYRKPQLKDAVEYIENNFTEKYPKAVEKIVKKKNITKIDYLNQILDFVVFSLPHTCLKCEGDYLPYVQDNGAEDDLKCFVCGLPAHKDCYKSEDVKLHLVFLCQICLVAETVKSDKRNQEEVKTREEKEDSASEDSGEDSDEDTSDSSSDEKWSKKERKVRKRKDKSGKKKKRDEICPLLMEGKCPHGISGIECEYKHKNICYKYCRFGTREMHRGGCRFGEECRFLHPTICQNSLTMQVCLSETCTNVHLQKTHRKPKESVGKQTSYRNPNIQREDSYKGNYFNSYKKEAPRYEQKKPYEQNNSYNQSYRGNTRSFVEQQNNQEHFLSQIMERMQQQLLPQIQREIRKELQLQTQQVPSTMTYNMDYPSMQEAGDPAWNQSHPNQW